MSLLKKQQKTQKQKHDDCCIVYWVTVMDDENMCWYCDIPSEARSNKYCQYAYDTCSLITSCEFNK